MIHADVDSRALALAFKQLPKELQQELRRHNRADAEDLARALRTDAHKPGVPPQAALIADSGAVTPKTDRNIRVDVGGKKIVNNRYKTKAYRANTKSGKSRKRTVGTPAGALVWGATVGSSGKTQDRIGRKMGPRFVESHSQRGYWLQPTSLEWAARLLPKYSRRIQAFVDRAHRGIS